MTKRATWIINYNAQREEGWVLEGVLLWDLYRCNSVCFLFFIQVSVPAGNRIEIEYEKNPNRNSNLPSFPPTNCATILTFINILTCFCSWQIPPSLRFCFWCCCCCCRCCCCCCWCWLPAAYLWQNIIQRVQWLMMQLKATCTQFSLPAEPGTWGSHTTHTGTGQPTNSHNLPGMTKCHKYSTSNLFKYRIKNEKERDMERGPGRLRLNGFGKSGTWDTLKMISWIARKVILSCIYF